MYRYSALSDEEKKEVYDKWHGLINMSQKALDSWATDDDRLLASINRQEAKEEGGIQSGYDSFHRIKRRKSKPFSEWSNDDFVNAKQEIGFNSRMLGGKPGQPVEDTGMSKWEISLRNWGHDPSLKSSPQHSKWKSWKETHTKKEARMYRQASVYNVLMAHEQNQKIRRAILASGNRADMAEMRKAFSILLNSSRTASATDVGTLLEQTDDPEVKNELGLSYLTEILNHYKDKVVRNSAEPLALISDVLKSEGLTGKLHTFVGKSHKPRTSLEKKISDTLKSAGSFSATLRAVGKLISARTPEQLADLVGAEFDEMRDYFGVNEDDWEDIMLREKRDIDPRSPSLADIGEAVDIAEAKISYLRKSWFLSKWENLNRYVVGLPDHKILVVKVATSILKVALIAFLAKTALGAIGMGIIKILAGILLVLILTNSSATSQLFRKLGISLTVVGKGVIEDIANGFSFLKGKASEYISRGWRKFKGLFRRAALERINYLLQTDRQFRLAYQRV